MKNRFNLKQILFVLLLCTFFVNSGYAQWGEFGDLGDSFEETWDTDDGHHHEIDSYGHHHETWTDKYGTHHTETWDTPDGHHHQIGDNGHHHETWTDKYGTHHTETWTDRDGLHSRWTDKEGIPHDTLTGKDGVTHDVFTKDGVTHDIYTKDGKVHDHIQFIDSNGKLYEIHSIIVAISSEYQDPITGERYKVISQHLLTNSKGEIQKNSYGKDKIISFTILKDGQEVEIFTDGSLASYKILVKQNNSNSFENDQTYCEIFPGLCNTISPIIDDKETVNHNNVNEETVNHNNVDEHLEINSEINCLGNEDACKKLINKINNLIKKLNQAGPLSDEALKQYQKEFAELMRNVGTEMNLEVSLVYKNVSLNNNLTFNENIAINNNMLSTLDNSKQFNFDLDAINDPEKLKQISEDTVETQLIDMMPNESSEMTFGDYMAIAEPFLVEILIAVLPFGDVIDLVRSIHSGDKLGVAFAMAGIISTAFGGSAVKGAIKGTLIFRKITRITTKLGNLAKAGANAARKGIKITLDSTGNLVSKIGNKVIAKGDDAVKSVVKHIDEGLPRAGTVGGETAENLAKARNLVGTASGNGTKITGNWLRGSQRNAGKFPKSIADKMKGKKYDNFNEFRKDFWKKVADDPNMSKQFKHDAASMNEMRNGRAPFADVSQQINGKPNCFHCKKYNIHHNTPINQGGDVFNFDNLTIVTPRYHKEILSPSYHKGYNY